MHNDEGCSVLPNVFTLTCTLSFNKSYIQLDIYSIVLFKTFSTYSHLLLSNNTCIEI